MICGMNAPPGPLETGSEKRDFQGLHGCASPALGQERCDVACFLRNNPLIFHGCPQDSPLAHDECGIYSSPVLEGAHHNPLKTRFPLRQQFGTLLA